MSHDPGAGTIMPLEPSSLCKLRFIGEVVETSRGAEACFAKVAIRHICVEIPSADCETIHLGDMIAFEAAIETHACHQVPSLEAR